MGPEHSIIAAQSLKKEHDGQLEKEYQDRIEAEMVAAIEKIIAEHFLLGEGKAGQVFDFPNFSITDLPACIKIIRPELEELRNKDLIEFRRIQNLSPEEEFKLQDKLYSEGFRHTPKPLFYGHYGKYQFLIMEKISGYTLKEIIAAKAKLVNLSWNDLEQLLIKLHRRHGVAHRDLHAGNIMVKTKETLTPDSELSGEQLVIIDFGLSKRTGGMPTREDYTLTIGKNSIIYPDDRANLEKLTPQKADSPFLE